MGIDLYVMQGSPPCASIQLVAKALGIELNIKEIDLMKKEQMKPEYIQMNPQHTVPTINDDGFCLWESRPIMVYLIEKYGKDDSLFPKCPKQRAIINQRLYFDMGTLYQRLGDIIYPIMHKVTTEVPEEKRNKLKEALGWLNDFLVNGYAAGDTISVADYALITTMAAMEAIEVDLSVYPNITTWLAKCKDTMAGFKEIDTSDKYRQFLLPMMKEVGVSL